MVVRVMAMVMAMVMVMAMMVENTLSPKSAGTHCTPAGMKTSI